MSDASKEPRFESHIKPLFRDKDQRTMKWAFDLWDYSDVRDHAADILERVANGTMPCDGPWPPERVAVFRGWVEDGMPE